MRLLLDMNMPLAAAEWLRSDGHDAVQLRELGFERLPDRRIVAYARRRPWRLRQRLEAALLQTADALAKRRSRFGRGVEDPSSAYPFF